MGGIAIGFSTIGVVIAAGWLAQRVGIVPPAAREMLIRLAFFVAAPALLVGVVADADLGALLQLPLLIQAAATAGAAAVFLLVNRLWLRLRPPETVVGAYGASYINAANIGIPVSVYVLGDAAASVPVILLQVLILGPLALCLLDLLTAGRPSWRLVATQPVRNPIILASAVGAVLALTGWQLPAVVDSPLRLAPIPGRRAAARAGTCRRRGAASGSRPRRAAAAGSRRRRAAATRSGPARRRRRSPG